MMLTPKSDSDFQIIRQLRYHTSDVLEKSDDRLKRASHLMQAALLDSISGSDAILVIQSVDAVRKIRSRVVAIGNERIMLERGISVPLGSILDVEFP